MKPHLLKVSPTSAQSFSARRDMMPDVNNRWHYHSALELIYFKRGRGTQFIGDNIKNFSDGDVVLVGRNLPHYWRFDSEYFENSGQTTADIYVVHFEENFWGSSFLDLPENTEIKKVIEQSKQGMQITGNSKATIGNLIVDIVEATGTKKILSLLEALIEISHCKEINYLVSLGFQSNFQDTEKDRIQAIYNYTLTNYKKKIDLKEIAEIAKISPNSFCKFFKSRSRKTYTQFTNEIRIGQACKLLIENQMSVKEICYESGFYNFASFHKCFKDIMGKSPLKYQQEFM
nr:helix-turn-helix domain-containing protein [Pedobacter sp. ASV2]